MKTVLTLLCALVVAHNTAKAADCPLLKQYDTTLQPVCDTKDLYIKWPNYANQYTYYTCTGVGAPFLVNCPVSEVFIYVLQECGACASYIPAPPCSQLKTQNPPVCVPIDSNGSTASTGSSSGSSLPTPIYPSTTSSTSTTRSTTTRTTSSTTTTAKPVPSPPTEGPSTVSTVSTTVGGPTPPLEVTTTTGPSTIQPPPSPVTNAPGVPTPPTPEPTPQVVDATPPERAT